MSDVDFRVKKGLVVATDATVGGTVTATAFIGDGSQLIIPIDALSNISISNPQDGDMLIYNSNTQLWESKPSFDAAVVAAIALG